MTDLDQTVASLAGISLSLGDWMAYLKERGRLVPLLREAALDRLVAARAAEAGLTVNDAELQQAADALRRRLGLTSAPDTRVWLARQHLTVTDFERALEANLLAEKLKDHVTRDSIAAYFTAGQEGFARAQLRLIQVAREDLARELVMQFREEGRDFAELAAEHSLHSSRANGGRLGWAMRRQFAQAVAAVVFAAREGSVVGPFASAQGFQVFLVEKLASPTLDAGLRALIREELFAAWLKEQLSAHKLEMPLLEALCCSRLSACDEIRCSICSNLASSPPG